jgi:hypothetical protein
MTLFWCACGPKISYDLGPDFDHENDPPMFIVEDLNPENRIAFVMTPMELMMFGFRCIWASIWP